MTGIERSDAVAVKGFEGGGRRGGGGGGCEKDVVSRMEGGEDHTNSEEGKVRISSPLTTGWA